MVPLSPLKSSAAGFVLRVAVATFVRTLLHEHALPRRLSVVAVCEGPTDQSGGESGREGEAGIVGWHLGQHVCRCEVYRLEHW